MNATKWHKRSAVPFNVEAHVNTRTAANASGDTYVQVSLVTTGTDEQQWLDLNLTNTEARALAELLVRRAGQVVAPPANPLLPVNDADAAEEHRIDAAMAEAAGCGCKPEPECVICDNEGPHHHGRPHVYAGQE